MAAPAAAQHTGHHGHHAPGSALADTTSVPAGLSPGEMAGLLEGRGLGLARPAELRSYPGPLHVLELADSLALSPDQHAEAQRLRTAVLHEATALGARIVQMERALDALFAQGAATPETVDRMTGHIAQLRGQLRAAHLRAHVAMRAALTPDQIATYDRLRGHTR